MALRWHDVTIPMEPGMTVWPGDPPFRMAPLSRIGAGDGCNTSQIELCTHTGTHVDAPWHFEDDGKQLDEMDTSLFFGEAVLVDAPRVSVVTGAMLGAGRLPERLLVRTDNSAHAPGEPFRREYVGLDAGAARRLVEDGVRLVGVDYLSVAPFKQAGQETHHTLLGNNVLVVEGLCLAGLRPGRCQFTVLPLHILRADGAPCRAFVGQEECS